MTNEELCPGLPRGGIGLCNENPILAILYMFECCAERKRVGWGWEGNEKSRKGGG